MLKKILCGATLLCAASFSNAGAIVQTFNVGSQLTNFSEIFVVDLFDDQGGNLILESVDFSLLAGTSGSAKAENLGSEASDVTATLSANVSLLDSASAVLAFAAPSVNGMATLGGYDGTLDFGGTSGETFLDLLTSDTDFTSLVDAISLAHYTGAAGDTTTVELAASATSLISGGGNLISSFTTFASGKVVITYNFLEASTVVSSPTQVALLGLGLLGLAGLRKTKK